MAPRHWVACVLVVLAGCAGLPGAGPGTGGTSTPNLEADVHPGMTADFEIRNRAEDSVHVTIVETNDRGRGVVLNETYEDAGSIEPTVFLENGDYRVTIRVNGTVEWDQRVKHFESIVLRINRNGTVDVVSHVIA